jgi:hypothetical protein
MHYSPRKVCTVVQAQTEDRKMKEPKKVVLNALFDELKQMIESAAPVPPPDLEVQLGEEFKGTLPEDFRAALSVKEELANDINALADILNDFGPSPKELDIKYHKLVRRHKILEEVFWEAVDATFDTYGKEVGIRAGWKVVLIPDREPDSGMHVVRLPLGALLGAFMSEAELDEKPQDTIQ